MLLCVYVFLIVSTIYVFVISTVLYSTNQGEDDFIMLNEDKELKASSMDVDTHEKRDVDGLLCFKKGITSDPRGYLSNWTAENEEKVCSW